MALLNSFLITALQRFPKGLVKPVAMRYIAGEKLEDAVRVVRGLNAREMMATVDVLGENVFTREESLLAVRACEDVLRAIQETRVNSNLSVKLSQLGLTIDPSFGYENTRRILQKAREYSNFVRIDMEDSSLTGATLDLYERFRGDGFENVGVAIQAYLRRSEDDVRRLTRRRVNVRMVKGIYIEPAVIAFQGRQEIRENYLKLLKMLLESGSYAAVATHDDFLVDGALRFISEMKLPTEAYEFQMLYGVREKLRDRIVADGHRMRIYVPFGQQWHPYSIRRFKENPQIARYVIQALLSGK
jgi:proline dehydrogenase